jgi:hypothetical protein
MDPNQLKHSSKESFGQNIFQIGHVNGDFIGKK